MSTKVKVTLHFDGACEPINPGGIATYGFVLSGTPGLGTTGGAGVVAEGDGATNNLAEWTALKKGLEELIQFQADGLVIGSLAIFGDSKLVVEQLAGRWACRGPNLIPLLAECRALLERLGVFWIAEWVPRERNQEADALSVAAWESHTNRKFPERKK